MSRPATEDEPGIPGVRLRMAPGTVHATVSLPGEDGTFRVAISVELCPGRLRRAANGLLVRAPRWRTPFETGQLPNLTAFAREVMTVVKMRTLRPKHLRAICSCPAGAGGCKHASAAVAQALDELSKDPVHAVWLHGLNLEEWARNPDVVEAGAEPRRLSICWRSSWEAVTHAPLGELPDLSVIPHLLEESLRRLDPAPLDGDVTGIIRDRMLATAAKVRETGGGGDPHIPVDSLDRVGFGLEDDGGVMLLGMPESVMLHLYDHEDGVMRHGGAFLAVMLVDTLRAVTPEDHGRLGERGRYWMALFRYVARLTEQCAMVPELVRGRRQGRYQFMWRPATMISEPVRAIHEQFVRACPPDLVWAEGISNPGQVLRASQATQVGHAVDMLFRGILAREIPRGPDGEREPYGPESILFEVGAFRFHPDGGLTEEDTQAWLRRLAIPDRHPGVDVRIAPDDEDPERITIDMDFFDEDGERAPLSDILDRRPTTWFLQALGALSEATGHDVAATAGDRAQIRFRTGLRHYRSVIPRVTKGCRRGGARLEIADSLLSLCRPRLLCRMSASGAPGAGPFDLSALVEFDWVVAVGDTLFPVGEFEQLVKEAREAIRDRGWGMPLQTTIKHVGGKYVELDDQFLFQEFERHASGRSELSHFELLRAALTREHAGSEVVLLPPAEELLQGILSPRDPPGAPDDLAGVLRPYQRTGFEWLAQNADVGFGSILADDMGLGKTVQAIALILHRTLRDPSHKTLVVAPTALLTNWVREIRRFAPALRAQIYHGGVRDLDLSRHDVAVTSYGIARRDTKALGERTWGLVVVDEAQAIKNPATQQARAIKGYRADARVALTGTPVENHLDDYWSVFDYTNRGYLGSLRMFRAGLARPIERHRDEDALRRFHRLTGPFVLRRLKTDKRIVKDLPEKIEGKRYCSLTAKQAALYQATIDRMMAEIADAGDETDPRNIRRRGLILKMLTELKQVCNSPSHRLGHQTAPPSESGKLALCLEILQELRDTGEKALVFTQYVEMGKLLVGAVRSETGEEPLFLHGGLARKVRDGVVDTFQGDPARRNMVLSLKAGGTGLNLTAATQVIHFDRWWNPAVERQATDRAHRIGQTRRVQVHLLVTENTLEEKIDAMLEDKKELAELTVRSGDKWLTDMTNRQLRELVELTRPLA